MPHPLRRAINAHLPFPSFRPCHQRARHHEPAGTGSPATSPGLYRRFDRRSGRQDPHSAADVRADTDQYPIPGQCRQSARHRRRGQRLPQDQQLHADRRVHEETRGRLQWRDQADLDAGEKRRRLRHDAGRRVDIGGQEPGRPEEVRQADRAGRSRNPPG